MKTKWIVSGIILWGGLQPLYAANQDAAKPNVIMIYYDDMGYSDAGIYDANQTSLTPNMDTFSSEGMRFTAGHSADAVCTPSRYAVMTGRYCWRTSRKTSVTGGYSAPLMQADRFTFPKMFQSLGYKTAMVGKWHIGMQFYSPSGDPVDLGNNTNVLDDDVLTTTGDSIDFSIPLTDTPYHQGFDYFFGTPASLDMPPYAWIENDTVLFKGGLVTTNGVVDFSQARPAVNADLEEGPPNGNPDFARDGVYDPNFIVSDYLEVMAAKVAELIQVRSADSEPFFFYIPMPAPHRPWAVSDDFAGSTPYAYGDYLAQTDHYTGLILDALADPDGNPSTSDSMVSNTVVFISSDNGPETHAFTASRNVGRDSNGPFRGIKRDNWEGGTRVPFLVRWPGRIEAGSITDHACWQGDFFASMAAYLGYDFADDEAPDSESILTVLLGGSMPAARREGFIQHAVSGQHAIVDKNGEWKLLDGTGGNGNATSYDADDNDIPGAKGVRLGSPKQLFNLLTDPGERTNRLLSATQTDLDKEAELYALLNEIRGDASYGTDGDSNVPQPDNDLDGMGNAFENTYAGLNRDDPTDGDGDFEPDGLNNLEEYQNGANPWDSDSDDDRLADAAEVYTYGTLAGNAHSDADALEDGDEILIWHTDPLTADTDGDGVNDDDELELFTSPRNAASVPVWDPATEVELDPATVQLAGSTGSSTDPAVAGGSATGWNEAGNLYTRSRTTTANTQEAKTQLFLRFDLSGISGELVSAKMRIHQYNRLNTVNSADLQLARVTEDWGTTSGIYPVYDGTGIADAFVFGNNRDFGTAVTASGFYSGTAGIPGTDEGFDVTSMVQGWFDGGQSNYGFRVAFNTRANVGAAFSETNNPSTADVNERLQLILSVRAPAQSADSDGDGLLDEYEMSIFTNLTTSGSDDGDLDGVSTLVEQALGSDPTTNASLPEIELITTNSVELSFHQYNKAGLGIEVLVSENLEEWTDFTRFYQIADPAPTSELGADYDKILFEPHSPLPTYLFYRLDIHTQP